MNRILSVAIFFVLFSAAGSGQTVRSARQDLLGSIQLRSPGTANAISDEGLSVGKKNVGLAVIYSLILPGMGELYVGEYGMGKYFTIAEGALWLTFTSFELYGTWLRDDARQFAGSHAGIVPAGKNDQYFIDIGNFINIYEYNDQRLRDREPERLYDVNSYFWQWDNEANRTSYRDLRLSSDRVFHNTRFVVAAIIVNHVVSAINAGRLAVARNRGVEQASFFDVYASVLGGVGSPHGIMVSFSKSF